MDTTSQASDHGGSRPATLADGRYRILHVLGAGGMATVYRAFDTRLDVERAIKILNPAVAAKKKLKARFDNEARTMAKLHHPNMVMVHDVSEDGDRTYMVMEILAGGSVMGWLERHGRMPPRLACEVMRALLAALAMAHSKGVIHRDIKPHNILLSEAGVPKVTDFGIAQVRDENKKEQLTGTGTVMGTWAYMAPEQKLSARKVDERSDVYAAGATFYALLTNEEPFDLFSTEIQEEASAKVPMQLSEILRKATRYRPEDRYANANEMLAAIDAVLPSLPADPEGTPPLGANLLPEPSAALEVQAALTFTSDEPLDDDQVPTGKPITLDREGPPKKTPPGRPAPRIAPTMVAAPGAEPVPEPAPGRGLAVPLLVGVGGLAVLATLAFAGVAVIGGGALVYGAGEDAVVEVGSTGADAPAALTTPPAPVVAEPAPPPVVPEPPAIDPVEVLAPAVPPVADPVVEAAPPPEPDPAKTKVNRPRDPATRSIPPTPPPSTAPVDGKGKLFYNSRPWSWVSVDGRPEQRTPRSIELSYGSHELALRTEAGATTRQTVVVDQPEERFCWSFELNATCPQ